MLKKNDTVELNIESITNLGFGVARYLGLVIFTADAVMGDTVEATIIKVTASYAVARVKRYIKRSAVRTDERCKNAKCHSCAYKCISYSEELKLKYNDVRGAFLKAGLDTVDIADVVPSPKEHEYRNKAQYPIAKDKDGNYVLGFYAPKSHRVTEAASCPLAPSVFEDILEELRSFFKRHSLSVYDEQSGKGLLRHVYLRRGEVSGEVLLTLVINGDTLPYSEELVGIIKKGYPEVVGILLNVNRDNTNIILGERFITLFGRDHIYDTLAGVKLKLSAPAFYQVNHDAAELLYRKALELASPDRKKDVLLDLYCGAGSIGLSMAGSVRELIGIEIVESAVECARENAKNAGIENASFYTGDAANTEAMLANAERALGKKIEPTIVILDPPRSGCDERLIRFVASLRPERIVYISCNPATLARDAAIFKPLGYECCEVTPFDLFALTGHVESVVCLKRQIQQ